MPLHVIMCGYCTIKLMELMPWHEFLSKLKWCTSWRAWCTSSCTLWRASPICALLIQFHLGSSHYFSFLSLLYSSLFHRQLICSMNMSHNTTTGLYPTTLKFFQKLNMLKWPPLQLLWYVQLWRKNKERENEKSTHNLRGLAMCLRPQEWWLKIFPLFSKG